MSENVIELQSDVILTCYVHYICDYLFFMLAKNKAESTNQQQHLLSNFSFIIISRVCAFGITFSEWYQQKPSLREGFCHVFKIISA